MNLFALTVTCRMSGIQAGIGTVGLNGARSIYLPERLALAVPHRGLLAFSVFAHGTFGLFYSSSITAFQQLSSKSVFCKIHTGSPSLCMLLAFKVASALEAGNSNHIIQHGGCILSSGHWSPVFLGRSRFPSGFGGGTLVDFTRGLYGESYDGKALHAEMARSATNEVRGSG
ncbi:hypothetical protein BDP81DRAFT_173618 [Colletotrichum phormii]|uniref:Uncharacterized protein n=1 Tax=Colletotrichum phormii TaxID=359342 RepID=A0AAI9ZDK3_9PEZI|nr:uncharacterized protein BDP81DRAFT_173618 [Colletotrichum phormii]KAK1621640.1 hypothetical protein BDP81DRAFT_173618 [Colletotrichum phormii]